MTAYRHPANSNEAEWEGVERVWAHIDQYPPKKDRSGWWIAIPALVLTLVAVAYLRSL